jgi:uncharacterized NAD-dependent epimerase/dehydratase family protein
MHDLPRPYLLFLGEATDHAYAKTAFGIRYWCPEDAIAQYHLPGGTIDLGLPDLDPAAAAAAGARSLLIGVAPIGGALSPIWIDVLLEAMAAGLDLVSGMHERLADHPVLAPAARDHKIRLHDLRVPAPSYPIATGRKRSGLRLLTVGGDCALGKKYAALAIAHEMKARGMKATFRATGQTGIMIAGAGIPIDAVVSDFVAGAAETLSPDNAPDHWDVIEGQGSILHPAYAGVSLGLLHGSQPDAFVVCVAPKRTTLQGFPAFPIAPPEEIIERTRLLGSLTNAEISCAGIAVNASGLSGREASEIKERLRVHLSLPVFDPIVDGPSDVVDFLEARFAGGQDR